MLNSRPLTHVADQPENEEPLTPNHFLLHRPYANLPPGVFDSSEQPLSFKSWKEIQKVTNHIWKRLPKEYLPTLHPRGKWSTAQPQLRVGDLAWILRDFTPRGIWPLGRITATHPGRDGVVRVCTVKTAYGTFDRPAVSLSRHFAPWRFAPQRYASSFSPQPLRAPFVFFAAKGVEHVAEVTHNN